MVGREVNYYDPVGGTHATTAYEIAYVDVVLLLPGTHTHYYRMQSYQAGTGTQLDNSNCVLFVLLAAEEKVFIHFTGLYDLKKLQFIRYRYLYICALVYLRYFDFNTRRMHLNEMS